MAEPLLESSRVEPLMSLGAFKGGEVTPTRSDVAIYTVGWCVFVRV